jgi:hypothetical protein
MDDLQFSPAAERNKAPILAVLKEVLPPEGTILEIASGSGQHAAYFAAQLAPRHWLPSEPDPLLRRSILAWRGEQPCPTLHAPLALDVAEPTWPLEDDRLVKTIGAVALPPIQAIVNINMIHISPWAACLALMAGANRLLPPGGVLYLYGPYKRGGEHTAPSNAAFDDSLRSRHPDWGLRNLEEVMQAARAEHLTLQQVREMPANNLSVIFTKVG